MKIACLSDQHGFLPAVPECDILVIAGDLAPPFPLSDRDLLLAQLTWLATSFKSWLDTVPAKRVVGIAGNHDHVFQYALPTVEKIGLGWTYLQDEGTEVEGFKIYGTPWQPWFYDWAFNAPQHDEAEIFLTEKYDAIPEGTDIILSHGPPSGIMDGVGRRKCGSKSFHRALERVQPRLAVFGHIHRYGVQEWPGMTLVNAAVTDTTHNEYNLAHEVRVVEI